MKKNKVEEKLKQIREKSTIAISIMIRISIPKCTAKMSLMTIIYLFIICFYCIIMY